MCLWKAKQYFLSDSSLSCHILLNVVQVIQWLRQDSHDPPVKSFTPRMRWQQSVFTNDLPLVAVSREGDGLNVVSCQNEVTRSSSQGSVDHRFPPCKYELTWAHEPLVSSTVSD